MDFRPVHPSSFFLDWLSKDPYYIDSFGIKHHIPITGMNYFRDVENNNSIWYKRCERNPLEGGGVQDGSDSFMDRNRDHSAFFGFDWSGVS